MANADKIPETVLDTSAMSLEGEELRAKRKGSPLSKDEAKKLLTQEAEKPYSLRRQNSLPNINKAVTSKDKSSKMAFSDMVRLTFNDAAFAKSMVPIMQDMLSPLIQNTISAAVSAATDNIKTTVLDKMVQSNEELQKLVSEQTGIINTQKAVITEQRGLIDEQKELLESKADKIEQLECDVEFFMLELDSLKADLNNLQQYSRRNSIRIHNFKPDHIPVDEYDMCNMIQAFLNRTVLQDSRPLDVRDIERCHYIGRTIGGRPKQILVKFNHYQDKKRVFGAKKQLKSNSDKIFLTEDLTSTNYAVVKQLLPLKKNGKINSFWTVNGQIYTKKTNLSEPVKISSIDTVVNKLGIELETSADPAPEPMEASV